MKKLLSTITALAAALTVVTVSGAQGRVAEAEETHTNHKVCGDLSCNDSSHADITWQAWTSATSLPTTSGKYYLTKDVTVTKETNLPSEILYICLNGHTITATNNSRIFYIKSGSFNLCDCKKSGKLTGGNPGDGEDGGAIYIYNAFVNLYDITISGNTAKRGGAIYRNNGFVTIYGGTITNNTATESGGGIYGKYFTIDGKADISGNTANGTANNVCLSTLSSEAIDIGNSFSTESSIGVSTAQTPTCSIAITGDCNSDISACFTADISGQKIKYENDKVWLYRPHLGRVANNHRRNLYKRGRKGTFLHKRRLHRERNENP